MKPLPRAPEAEVAVVHGVMVRPELLPEVSGLLAPDDFGGAKERAIFAGMLALEQQGRPIDPVTLEHQLRSTGELSMVGGLDALGRLGDGYAISHHVVGHARMVAAVARQRRMVQAARDVAEQGCEAQADVDAWVSDAEQRILAASGELGLDTERKPTARGVSRWLEALRDRTSNPTVVTGMTTGLAELDLVTTGLQPGALVVVAGRPGMGKSALATQMALAVGAHGYPTLIWSGEMAETKVIDRLVSQAGRLDGRRLRAGAYLRDGALATAVGQVQRAPIEIVDRRGLTIEQIRSVALRWRRSVSFRSVASTGILVIDHAGLVRPTVRGRNANREQEIGHISRTAKVLAGELGVAVVLLSQLNRECERRTPPRPMLSDLRDSGSIEQDADIVLFVYRAARYLDRNTDEYRRAESQAELIVAKNREGEEDIIRVRWTGECTRFDDEVT